MRVILIPSLSPQRCSKLEKCYSPSTLHEGGRSRKAAAKDRYTMCKCYKHVGSCEGMVRVKACTMKLMLVMRGIVYFMSVRRGVGHSDTTIIHVINFSVCHKTC